MADELARLLAQYDGTVSEGRGEGYKSNSLVGENVLGSDGRTYEAVPYTPPNLMGVDPMMLLAMRLGFRRFVPPRVPPEPQPMGPWNKEWDQGAWQDKNPSWQEDLARWRRMPRGPRSAEDIFNELFGKGPPK